MQVSFKSASIFLAVCAIIPALSCHTAPAKQYGFLTMLGHDTLSVENVDRQGTTLTSDEVDRFPEVRIRHTVVDLNDDGSIRHLEMEIHTPGEPPGMRDRKVIADVGTNKVHLSKTDSTGTVDRDFATGGGIVVAHVQQMYSMYELYFAAAMKKSEAAGLAAGTPVEMRQFYIDREFDKFPLGHATVTLRGNSKAEVYHDWLSGIGDATMDSGYNMLSYSGARTTYKVSVTRLAEVADIKAIGDRWGATEASAGNPKSLSAQDSVRAQIGDAIFTVNYSRPLARGRTLLGDVIPYDRVWRTGANAATQFTTSKPIRIGGLQVPAGAYTLFTAPHTGGVDLIVNKQTGEWGTDYNRSLDLGSTRMISDSTAAPAEKFTISIVPIDSKHGKLVLEWGSFRWTTPVEVMK